MRDKKASDRNVGGKRKQPWENPKPRDFLHEKKKEIKLTVFKTGEANSKKKERNKPGDVTNHFGEGGSS